MFGFLLGLPLGYCHKVKEPNGPKIGICDWNLRKRKRKMGLISGVFMGMVFGIALMAGWKHMMRYRSTKRIAKAEFIHLVQNIQYDSFLL
nr:hypothetical protein CFP56_77717 [Quercus suber]